MALRILPDIEVVTGSYLRSVAELAALVGSKVGTTRHGTWSPPLVVLQRIGGTSFVRHTVSLGRMQATCWGTTQSQAHQVAATVQAAWEEMIGHTFEGGVVTEVVHELGPIPVPDPDTSAPRYLLQAGIWLRSTS